MSVIQKPIRQRTLPSLLAYMLIHHNVHAPEWIKTPRDRLMIHTGSSWSYDWAQLQPHHSQKLTLSWVGCD